MIEDRKLEADVRKDKETIENVCYKYSRWSKEHFFRNEKLSLMFLMSLPYLIEEVKEKENFYS